MTVLYLFNNENPYYEKWKVGRPSFKQLEKRAKYFEYEKLLLEKLNSPKCFNYPISVLIPQKK